MFWAQRFAQLPTTTIAVHSKTAFILRILTSASLQIVDIDVEEHRRHKRPFSEVPPSCVTAARQRPALAAAAVYSADSAAVKGARNHLTGMRHRFRLERTALGGRATEWHSGGDSGAGVHRRGERQLRKEGAGGRMEWWKNFF